MKLNNKGFAPIAVVIAVVVALAVAVGVYVFMANNDSDDDSSTSTSQSTSSGDEIDFFSPVEPPYVATISSTDSSDPSATYTGTVTYESATKYQVATEGNGQSLVVLVDGNYTYTSQDGGATWIRFPFDSSDPGTADDPAFSEEELEAYKSRVTKTGTEACATGTCDVYKVNDEDATFYVDQDSKTIVKIVVVEGTVTTEIAYDFSASPTVTVPTEYQELNIPTAN